MKPLAYRPGVAASLLGISKRTLTRWIKSGRIRSNVVGGVRLIPSSEVERIAGVTLHGAEYEQQPAVKVSAFARETLRRVRSV